jgi:hypothetical protein
MKTNYPKISPFFIDGNMLAQGQTQGSTSSAHQQALATGPFSNTWEAATVSPKESMWGLQDRDVYNQKECKVGSK